MASWHQQAMIDAVRKWPPDHWHLAFQGQLRAIGEADGALHERFTSTAATNPAAEHTVPAGA